MALNWRNSVIASSVLAVAVSITTARPQQNTPGFSISMDLTNLETGVPRRQPESYITVKLACDFDDWSKTVNWGDGNQEELAHTAKASLPGPTTPRGTYPLFTKHSYAKSGTYTATVQLYVHCSGDAPSHPGVLRYQGSFTVIVFDRLPLNTMTLSSGTVRRGQSLDVAVQTYADAPASGTRVTFSANKRNVFGAGALAVHSDIPQNSKTTSIKLTVSPSAPLGQVIVTATAGSVAAKTVTITR